MVAAPWRRSKTFNQTFNTIFPGLGGRLIAR
jgi:hypothetical protein